MILTPTLALGSFPVLPAVHVRSARRAVHVIRSGRRAVLPEGAYDEARKALRMMGATDTWIDEILQFAQGYAVHTV